ncbi:hypothetical protein LXL04_033015 [Taraxacum kok-saghyz]
MNDEHEHERRNKPANPHFRRLISSPARVYSFDSAMSFQEQIDRELPPSRPFQEARHYKDPIGNIHRSYSQVFPNENQKMEFLWRNKSLFISQPSFLPEGAHLMLPYGTQNSVITVYDNDQRAHNWGKKRKKKKVVPGVYGLRLCIQKKQRCGKTINFKNDNEIMGLEMVFVDDKVLVQFSMSLYASIELYIERFYSMDESELKFRSDECKPKCIAKRLMNEDFNNLKRACEKKTKINPTRAGPRGGATPPSSVVAAGDFKTERQRNRGTEGRCCCVFSDRKPPPAAVVVGGGTGFGCGGARGDNPPQFLDDSFHLSINQSCASCESVLAKQPVANVYY